MFYSGGIGFNLDDHTLIAVHSFYLTLDELIPIFESLVE